MLIKIEYLPCTSKNYKGIKMKSKSKLESKKSKGIKMASISVVIQATSLPITK